MITTTLLLGGKKMNRSHDTLSAALNHVGEYPVRSVYDLRIDGVQVTLSGDTERQVRCGEITPAEAAAVCLRDYEYAGKEKNTLEAIANGSLIV